MLLPWTHLWRWHTEWHWVNLLVCNLACHQASNTNLGICCQTALQRQHDTS